MLSNIRNQRFYKPTIRILSVLLFIFLVWLGTSLVSNPRWFLGDDFVEYWAAGRLNLSGGNPYDPEQLHPLELQTGSIEGEAVMMWNPPWLLTLAMPFGALSYPLSRSLWLLLNIVVLSFAFIQLWSMYGGSNELRWVAILVGFTFAPILDGLKKGQTSALLLLGVVAFLYFLKQRRMWLAGVSLALLAVKPHILYLFFIAVLLWVIDTREWKVLLGMSLSLLIATSLSWLVNPLVFQQYMTAVSSYPPANWATPTLGGLLRILLGYDLFWLQFLPPFVGALWVVYYWRKHRGDWDWLDQAPLLVVVSTFTTAYGWSWDQSVSIIAIIQIATLLLPRNKNIPKITILISYLVVDILALAIRGNQFWTFWLAPAMLVWYLVSLRLLNKSSQMKSINSAIEFKH